MNVTDLKLLALFSLVIEEGSFAAAARKTGTSRSRLSEQVSALEEHLDIRLLHRTTRQLALTEEGKQVYQHARQLAGILDQVRDIRDQKTLRGQVRITVTGDVGIERLIPALRDFSALHPEVTFDVIASDEKLDLVAEGIDLAVRVGLPLDDKLRAKVLFEDHFGLYASPGFLARHAPINEPGDLENLPWIFMHQSRQAGLTHFRWNDRNVELKPRHIHLCNSPLVMQHMAINGVGIAPLLPTMVHDRLSGGDLVPILPGLLGTNVVFSLIYPSNRHMPLRVKAVRDFILESPHFQAHPAE